MKSEQVLKILEVVAWFIFIGLCIKTGALIFTLFISHFINIEGLRNLYMGMNFHELYTYGKVHYFIMVSLILILSILKAYLFFWLIKIISGINLSSPFNIPISKQILKMSSLSLQIGITSLTANIYAQWLMNQQIHFTYEGSETEFLFFAAILFVVYQIFKKGIELQTETDLTI